MYTVTKNISFCYGHRLLNYDGKCKFLHGHNGRAEITLKSDVLDHRGMVVDFSDVKNLVGTFIKTELDHKMLLNKKDKMIEVLKGLNEPYYVTEENPTAENIARLIFEFARGKNLPVVSVKLWETDTSYAVYSA